MRFLRVGVSEADVYGLWRMCSKIRFFERAKETMMEKGMN